MKNQEPTIRRHVGLENAPINWVDNVYHLYIVEIENVPEGTDASDLPRMYREPGNAVAKFSTAGSFETEIGALIVNGLAFRKGWSKHNTISFFTQSYNPAFKRGNQ
tara:strand:+ start:3696 stop:4013 length:318 start_codon:yes stop_codon:yes gene_type:complete